MVNAVGSDYRYCVIPMAENQAPQTKPEDQLWEIIQFITPPIRPKHRRFPFATLKPPEALYNEGITKPSRAKRTPSLIGTIKNWWV